MGAHYSVDIQSIFLANFTAKFPSSSQELPSYSEVYDSELTLLSCATNQVELQNNTLHHSEQLAIDQAIQNIKSKYLENCILITTLEPCLHCMGTIVKSRIAHVIYFLPNDQGDGISHAPIDWIYQLNHFPTLELRENEEIFSRWKTFFMDKR